MGQNHPQQRLVVPPGKNAHFETGSTLGNRPYTAGTIKGSCKGKSRLYTEDTFSIYHFTSPNGEELYSIFVVCDGHGGYESSKYTTDNLPKFLHEQYKSNPLFFKINEALIDSFLRFDKQLLEFLENTVKTSESQHNTYWRTDLPKEVKEGRRTIYGNYLDGRISKRPPGTTVETVILIEYPNKKQFEIINLHVGDSESTIPLMKCWDPDIHTGQSLAERNRALQAGGVVEKLQQYTYLGIKDRPDWDGENDDFLYQMSRTFGNPAVKSNDQIPQDKQIHIPVPSIRRRVYSDSDVEFEGHDKDCYLFMFSDGIAFSCSIFHKRRYNCLHMNSPKKPPPTTNSTVPPPPPPSSTNETDCRSPGKKDMLSTGRYPSSDYYVMDQVMQICKERKRAMCLDNSQPSFSDLATLAFETVPGLRNTTSTKPKDFRNIRKYFGCGEVGESIHLDQNNQTTTTTTTTLGKVYDFFETKTFVQEESYMSLGLKLLMFLNSGLVCRPYDDDMTLLCLRLNRNNKETNEIDEDQNQKKKRKRDEGEEGKIVPPPLPEEEEPVSKKRKLD